MATAKRTNDREEIRRWVETHDGRPAIVAGTGGVLRIDFGEPEQQLEQVSWDRFFEIFDRSNVDFLYDPRGHMVKFVQRDENGARGMARRKSSGRKSSSRKKSTGARKKSTGGRKKSTGGRKKSTGGRKKSTGGRKKSTGGRKKSTGGRKKSSSRKGGRKKSGRKYGPKAGRKVERSMREMKRGELKSGRSGKKVKSRKQAIAIGLSEARRSGGKVPPNPNRKGGRRKKSR
ncbi:MAG TPA: DUF6496 domain-containing protein [Candidatus Baltobacteraceae bacterium]|nr:DUF6496 domain-containing protein [Candidatus Baltobacteraceae bacterium]